MISLIISGVFIMLISKAGLTVMLLISIIVAIPLIAWLLNDIRKLLKVVLIVLCVFFSSIGNAQNEPEKMYPTRPIIPNGNYFLHTGFTFDAVLETGIFSFNSITPVVAIVEYDVYFLEETMIPRGTLLIGTCQVQKSLDRVLLTFRTMVFPNGQEIAMNGIGLNVDGSGGIPGKTIKNNKKKLPVTTAIKVGGAAMGALGNPVTSALAGGVQSIAQEEIQDVYDYAIEIKKGTAFIVFINDRMEY
jgi:hypothetical protein